ncbi:MAG: YqgE/AlgH family protein [Bacteroidales bacterium]|nr:YqgE/AlgH family protein [Bacteroidales bacterium]
MTDISKFLKIKSNNIAPSRGKLLISEPFLNDYYFKRSVVLLAEHNEEGSFGVIMNKPVTVKFNEVIKDFPDFDAPLYLGGPVKSDSLFFVHTMGSKISNSIEIIDGLYWGGNINEIKEMIMLGVLNSNDIRFYIGYSGWESKQLESELEKNSWLVSTMNSKKLLTTEPDILWKTSLDTLGNDYKIWNNFPSDPGSN